MIFDISLFQTVSSFIKKKIAKSTARTTVIALKLLEDKKREQNKNRIKKRVNWHRKTSLEQRRKTFAASLSSNKVNGKFP